MRTAGRHTAPPVIHKRVRRPPPDPDSPLQTRQTPPAMRPALPCSPGNRRPPCDQPHLAAPAIAACHADQPTLQTRQPPPARHAALPPYRPNRCRTTQAVPRKTDGCSTFTALPPLHSQKGQRGQPEGPTAGRGRGGEGCNRKSPQPHPAGLRVAGSATGKPASDRTQPEGPVAVSNRGRGGEGHNRKCPQPYPAGTRRESDRVFRRLCTICKPKYTF